MKVDFKQSWFFWETDPRAQVFESRRFSLGPELKVYVTIAFTFILLWAVIIFGFIYPCHWRKARQFFISSCFMFLEEKTLSKYVFASGWIYPSFNQSVTDAWMVPRDTKLYLYWISPWWLNTVTGDETGLPPSKWKVVPHHRCLRPLLFPSSSVGSFTSHKNQNSERALKRGLWFSFLS